MKKMILMLCVAATFGISTAFASLREETVNNKKVMASFQKEFTEAKNVEWFTDDKAQNYTANFTIRESKVTAHFDADGNLLNTSRYLNEDQLPLAVTNRLAKKYAGQRIENITEYQANGEVTYYITERSKDDMITIVKATPDGWLSVYNKFKQAM
ncbi:hypothetical protein DCC81_04655 [Chitinophaga parva]|uniref:Beta-lactamase-inhibitor-like PepSY-like domain-containing protein n=1 Tax=Chitinophaga parva TaxID=2169414 RepID=A0A2T7BMB9_9BACT|nr:hypothetical protein [Chitinophaga parva]PUZ28780.1 hypothetical protein DCC81_04655 [Chitinophaga parva]